ncbi:hypothetical protein [Plesiomonas shigelloides]|uniref:hypothetical protein n=1 Tax=Plesiomonas shigelloides TaxID=703 RepID=UPI0012E88642|nr:hypothetical protein [Plesiomonas shigelloides]
MKLLFVIEATPKPAINDPIKMHVLEIVFHCLNLLRNNNRPVKSTHNPTVITVVVVGNLTRMK